MRKCGDCQACCKLIPLEEYGKLAGERCKHQKHGVGCAIYGRHPISCRLWSCMWLLGESVGQRPDRSGVVVDMALDYVHAGSESDGIKDLKMPVLQIWADEDAPDDVWDTPDMRKFIARKGRERGLCALVRFGQKRGMFIVPPELGTEAGISPMNGGKWFIAKLGEPRDEEHTVEEKVNVLGVKAWL